jgi:polar amino acid transport system substrate-binding protein
MRLFKPVFFTSLLLCAFLCKADKGVDEQNIVVLTESWIPFNHLDKNNEVVGTSTLVVKKILDDANILYTIKLSDWQSSFDLARVEPNSLIYSIIRTPIRESMFHWLCPINKTPKNAIYALSSRNDIVIKTFDDVKNHSISVTRGAFPLDVLNKKGVVEGRNMHLTLNNDINIEMLLKGKVDLIVEAEQAVYLMLRGKGLSEQHVKKVLSFTEAEQPQLCLALNKDMPQYLIDKITQSHQKVMARISGLEQH